MFKILLSLLILLAANTHVIAQNSVTAKPELSADDKLVLFENLIKKFNTSIETNLPQLL